MQGPLTEYKVGRDPHRGISKFKHEALGRNIDAARTTSLLTFSSLNIYSLKKKAENYFQIMFP